ncbi:HEPN domain-containing protein [Novosphingobium sp. KCTC 2891]|uniref:HEPN domain-containing protein n=1 Tax=Novosphingobium sp. KCTC 2891 TaxID=2989730 RepID=UPI0022229473|nr:HEPN domain-containing protein [Novosphingobium sp. KCTC 2891]MCW1385066.1 HEPN domain-containing protein [Novosphingobium sp. KCTC 2891]
MAHRYAPTDPLHPLALKDKQRTLRDGFPTPLALRVHRALSWLIRAEHEEGDLDVRFVLSWIGFNAAYAGDVALALGQESQRERDVFMRFFTTLVGFDGKHRLYNMVWQRFAQEIRVLLGNRHVFAAFWLHHNGVPGFDDWRARMDREDVAIRSALARHDTATLLSIVFGRLYVLRNQLVHGGATWNSAVNRDQVRDGAAILTCLLPLFIDLMMENPGHDWPMPHYPVVPD